MFTKHVHGSAVTWKVCRRLAGFTTNNLFGTPWLVAHPEIHMICAESTHDLELNTITGLLWRVCPAAAFIHPAEADSTLYAQPDWPHFDVQLDYHLNTFTNQVTLYVSKELYLCNKILMTM